MATQTVTVTVTADSKDNLTLTLDKTSVNLNPGDILEWDFVNVPSDCVPGILFNQEPGVSGSAFGPFQDFLLVGNTVVGRGNLGTSDPSGEPYSYTPQLLNADGLRPASADTGTVLNRVPQRDMSPITVIPCQTTFDAQGNPIAVKIGDIDPLKLFVGDTAIWYVTGLPLNFFVNPIFTLPVGDSTVDSAVQPFRYVLFNRGVDEEGLAVLQVIGVDFQPGTEVSFTYKVQARNFFGDVMPPPDDPQIDNLGPPPQG